MKQSLVLLAVFGAVLASANPPPARLAASLNPVSPATLCDRFIKETDQASCRVKAEKLDLDWYAASVCDMIDDDGEFMKCWADVDGKIYSPVDLVECLKDEMEDSARRDCLRKVSRRESRNGRMPASEKGAKKNAPVYQP